ncbi:MAG: hypothetical protein R3E32_02335 [Chitinophagales bacterium]
MNARNLIARCFGMKTSVSQSSVRFKDPDTISPFFVFADNVLSTNQSSKLKGGTGGVGGPSENDIEVEELI